MGGAVQRNISLIDLAKSFPTNKYLIAKISFDTAENEPLKVWITDHTFDHIPSLVVSELQGPRTVWLSALSFGGTQSPSMFGTLIYSKRYIPNSALDGIGIPRKSLHDSSVHWWRHLIT